MNIVCGMDTRSLVYRLCLTATKAWIITGTVEVEALILITQLDVGVIVYRWHIPGGILANLL